MAWIENKTGTFAASRKKREACSRNTPLFMFVSGNQKIPYSSKNVNQYFALRKENLKNYPLGEIEWLENDLREFRLLGPYTTLGIVKSGSQRECSRLSDGIERTGRLQTAEHIVIECNTVTLCLT